MITSFLKSGVQINPEDSAGLVLQDQVVQDEMDALAIRRQGQARAQGFNQQADLSIFEGEEAIRSSRAAATQTILGTAAKATSIAATAGSGGGTGAEGGAGTTITTTAGKGVRI